MVPDIVKEYAKYDSDPSKFRVFETKDSKTGQVCECEVHYFYPVPVFVCFSTP